MNLLKKDSKGHAIIPVPHEGDNVLDFVEDEENFEFSHCCGGGFTFVVHFHIWNKADQSHTKMWLNVWAECVFKRFKIVYEPGDPNYDDPGDCYIESMDDCIDVYAADFHSEDVYEETTIRGEPFKEHIDISKGDACKMLRCSEADFDSVLAKACAFTKEKTQKYSEKFYLEEHPEALEQDLADSYDPYPLEPEYEPD